MLLDKLIFDDKVRTSQYGEYHKAVFKFEPARRMINLSYNNYFLSFPVIHFSLVCRILDGKYRFTSLKAAFGDTSTDLYYAAFANIWPNLSFCMGIDHKKQFNSFEEMSEFVLNSFWSSKFSSNLGGNPYAVPKYDYPGSLRFPSILGDVVKWHTKTQVNPKWIPKITEMKKIEKKAQLNYFRKKK